MIVVGLTGLPGAGKDTVADYLVEHHGFTKLAFASDLKAMLNTLNPIISDDGTRLLDVRRACAADVNAELVLKKHYPEYRRLLDTLGTECIRERDSFFWIDQVRGQIDQAELEGVHKFVISDCRFPNEVGMLDLRYLAHFWFIDRPNLPRPPGNVHESRKYVGAMGETPILNDGDLPALYQRVDEQLARALG